MARQIFIVTPMIVDANSNFSIPDGYPKKFDSANYSNDVDKAKRRAEGDMSEVWGAMCKRDDRIIQTVSLTTVDGFLIECKTSGSFPAADPEPVVQE